MSAVALDDAAHADSGCALEKSPGNDGVGPRDGITASSDGEDTVVNALDDLANTGFYASFITEVGNILAALSNDNTSFLGGNNGAQSQLSLGIFFVRLRGELAVGAKSLVHLQLVQRVHDVAAIGRKHILRSRHDC